MMTIRSVGIKIYCYQMTLQDISLRLDLAVTHMIKLQIIVSS